jgi:predicted translin family RNA/ssDNA-binding protein
MKLEVFKEIVNKLQEQDQILDRIYSAGIDITQLMDPMRSVVSHLIGSIYGKVGLDVFSWWCYEKEWGTRTDLTMTDAEGKTLCNTIEELHEYLESFDENEKKEYSLRKKLSDEERTEMLKNLFTIES